MKIALPPLYKHQYEFLTDNTTRFLGLVGGVGCGKTYSVVAKSIILASMNVGYVGAILSPIYKMTMANIEPELTRQLNLYGIPYQRNKSLNEFYLQLNGQRSTILLRETESFDRIAGGNWAWCCIDEADRIAEVIMQKAWIEFMQRVRVGKTFQTCAVSTPEGFKWMYDFFGRNGEELADPPADRKVIHACSYDNTSLPPGYVAGLEANMDPKMAQGRIYGQFVNMTTGNVYYTFDRKVNCTDEVVENFPVGQILHIGIDFNIGNCNAVVCVVKDSNILCVDQFTKIQNTEALANAIRAKYPKHPIYLYPDPAGNARHTNSSLTDMSILKNKLYGFNVFHRAAHPEILNRVGAINAKIRNATNENALFVNIRKCKDLVETLEHQGFIKDEPDKKSGLDHMGDALGYFVEYRWPISVGGTITQL